MDQPSNSTPPPSQKGLSGKDWMIGISVAIACIAVFAVVGYWVVKKSSEPKIRPTMQALVVALKSYQTEYNRFPLPKGQVAADSTMMVSGGLFLDALLAVNEELNPREIKFIDLPVAKKNGSGLLERDGKRTLVDPWGNPYGILLDFDGDGHIAHPDHSGRLINETVVVFSGGPDGNPTTWQDNVKSWD